MGRVMRMPPLYYDPHFIFRFADDRVQSYGTLFRNSSTAVISA